MKQNKYALYMRQSNPHVFHYSRSLKGHNLCCPSVHFRLLPNSGQSMTTVRIYALFKLLHISKNLVCVLINKMIGYIGSAN